MPSRLDKFKAAVDELERQVGGATDRARSTASRARERGRQAASRTRRGAERAAQRVQRGADETVDRVESADSAADERGERVQERVETGAEAEARTADQQRDPGGGDSSSSDSSVSRGAQRLRKKAKQKTRERGRVPFEDVSADSDSATSARSGSGRAERVRERIERVAEEARDDAAQLKEDIERAQQVAGASTGVQADESVRDTEQSDPPELSAGESPRTERAGRAEPDRPLGADVGLEPDRAEELAGEIAAQDERIDQDDIAGFERVEPDPGRGESVPRDGEPVFRAELTDEARRDIAREQIAEQNPKIDAGDIERLEPTDDGAYQAVLTDEAQRDLAEAPGEPEGGPLDSDRLLERTSPGSQLFGLEARERAIEAEAQDGSRSAQLFVGGEALEAAGADASRAVDDFVPDPDFLEESQEVPVVTSFGRTTVDVNPKLGVGREGTRPGEAVRNFVVDTPAGAGVLAALGPRAAGDVGLRAEAALGRNIDSDAQVTGSETVEGVESAGGTVVEGARQDPVGAGLDLALPYAASKASPVRIRSRRIPLDAFDRFRPRDLRLGIDLPAEGVLGAEPGVAGRSGAERRGHASGGRRFDDEVSDALRRSGALPADPKLRIDVDGGPADRCNHRNLL